MLLNRISKGGFTSPFSKGGMRGIFSVHFDKSPLAPLFQIFSKRGIDRLERAERNSWNEQPLKRKILK
jgi:hypothetical protein